METKIDVEKESLINRLLKAQEDIQIEKDKTREETKQEYDEKIKELQYETNKAIVEKENLSNELKDCKKQLSVVTKKVKEEIEKGIIEQKALLDYTPKILSICAKFEENSYGNLLELVSLHKDLKEFDEISMDRISAMLITLSEVVNNLETELGLNNLNSMPSSKNIETSEIMDTEQIEELMKSSSGLNFDDIEETKFE